MRPGASRFVFCLSLEQEIREQPVDQREYDRQNGREHLRQRRKTPDELRRALEQPGMSVVLTVVSLGTRVGLAYLLSAIPAVGVVGIWWAVPIGWFLADALGVGYYLLRPAKALSQREYRS